MLTENQLDELYDECNRPYTEDELDMHEKNRSLKSELEIAHAYNYKAIAGIRRWIAYVNGCGDEPDVSIWYYVRPSHRVINGHCQCLKNIVDHFLTCEYRHCARLPIFVYCTRSTATMFKMLLKLHDTENLLVAFEAISDMMLLASNNDEQSMTTEAFHARLQEQLKTFIAHMHAYSDELRIYLHSIKRERATEKCKPATQADVAKIVNSNKDEIVKDIEEDGAATRRTVKASAKKVVKDITTERVSDYERRGPRGKRRAKQVEAVVECLKGYKKGSTRLPDVLKDKNPNKWIHQACVDTWSKENGGYPSIEALYNYCASSRDRLLSRAGI